MSKNVVVSNCNHNCDQPYYMCNLCKIIEKKYRVHMTIGKTSMLVILIIICHQPKMQKLSNRQNYLNGYCNNSVSQLYCICNLCKMVERRYRLNKIIGKVSNLVILVYVFLLLITFFYK